ncbi:DUF2711 family protein [Variovorax sp. J22G21]|uniref:DUF2711 family protein n=1 Tax=Variovorax fucosicus TaxID=3053517 RepID=UPI002575D8C6|nr:MULTISPECIES: DUF2711 family protein [unclassified Variovorax]MDM0039671.1 DUF2711 family protein [Variovorax sp. J22R193]MDM0064446.1 DUF2711 family protein [Variovorax sp. J22G21]
MNKRVSPDPDRYAVCPMDGPVLAFYEGEFEAAYVLLNPFLRPKSTTFEVTASALDGMSVDELCRAFEAVRWSEVRDLCGFPSIASIDVALRTMIGGLGKEHADKELADVLANSLKRHGLLPPVEGMFPALVQEPLLSFVQSLEQDWLWVGDEFCTERKLCWIDDLKLATANMTLVRGSVFTPDKAALWTVHWDSHFTLFCSSSLNVQRLARHPVLEGFVCAPETEIYWSVQGV